MAGKAKRRVRKIVGVLLVLLLLVGLLAAVHSCVSGGITLFKFTLKYDGGKLQPDVPFTIQLEKDYKIDVVDSSDISFSAKEFTVKIVARFTDNEDVIFKADGITQTLYDLPDLTDYLLAEKGNDYFVLNLSLDFPSLLQVVYSEYLVSEVPSFADVDNALLNLVVTSADGNSVIVIPLLVDSSVWDITFDETHIIF